MCVSPEHQREMGEGTRRVRGGGARGDSGKLQPKTFIKWAKCHEIQIWRPCLKGKYISINARYSVKAERNGCECEIGYEGHIIMMEKLSTVTLYLVHTLKPVTTLKRDTLGSTHDKKRRDL